VTAEEHLTRREFGDPRTGVEDFDGLRADEDGVSRTQLFDEARVEVDIDAGLGLRRKFHVPDVLLIIPLKSTFDSVSACSRSGCDAEARRFRTAYGLKHDDLLVCEPFFSAQDDCT
jgi:hypothetical protein